MSALKDTNFGQSLRLLQQGQHWQRQEPGLSVNEQVVPPHSPCFSADSGDDEVLLKTTKLFAAALQQLLQQLLKQQPWHHEQQQQQTGRPPRALIVEDAAAANAKGAFEPAVSPLSLLLQLQLQLAVASTVWLLGAACPRLKVGPRAACAVAGSAAASTAAAESETGR
ncbi:hypothetical protein Emed_007294 [Eimeria media]